MSYIDRLREAAENLGWSMTVSDDCVEFENWSPAGEDFIVSASPDCIAGDVARYYEDFDPEDHAGEMWQAKKNGFAGVPGLRELLDDADEIDEMLGELASALADVEEDEPNDEDEEDIDGEDG